MTEKQIEANRRVIAGEDRRIDGEKIIESLNVIKKVCQDHINTVESCSKCPMFNNELCCCCIGDTKPYNWKVLKYTKFQAME